MTMENPPFEDVLHLLENVRVSNVMLAFRGVVTQTMGDESNILCLQKIKIYTVPLNGHIKKDSHLFQPPSFWVLFVFRGW